MMPSSDFFAPSAQSTSCVSLGGACGSYASGLGEDCLFSGGAATTCNVTLTSASPQGLAFTGTCTDLTTAQRADAVFGSLCSPLRPQDCIGFEPWISMASQGAYFPPAPYFTGSLMCGALGTCGYGAEFNGSSDPSYPVGQGLSTGDPCTPQTGCGSSPHLTCTVADGDANAQLMTCARRDGSGTACSSTGRAWNDCPHGSYCSVDGACIEYVPEGGQCSCAAATLACMPGLICIVPVTGFVGALCFTVDEGTVGTCLRQNSLQPDSRIFVPLDSPGFLQSSSRSSGVALCASALAVPLPDSFGYSSNTSTCVTAWDWSIAGQPCPYCTTNAAGRFPLAGDGSLSCLPTVPGTGTTACTAVPSFAFSADALKAQVAFGQCVWAAQSPAGTPCANFNFFEPTSLMGLVEGKCAYYACYASYANLQSRFSVPNALWASYFSEPCLEQNARAAVAYASDPSVGCSLPKSLADQGWKCQTSSSPSEGGGGSEKLSREDTIIIAVVSVIVAAVITACGVGVYRIRQRRLKSSAKVDGTIGLAYTALAVGAGDN